MNCVAKKQTMPAVRPIATAPIGPTKPDAGVIVPKPATIPVTMPRTLGLPNLIHSIAIQTVAPAAAAVCVTSIAMPALPLAASALPALKPNHPTHSSDAPVTVIVRLCGGIAVHDGTAREVAEAALEQPTVGTPNPVGDREIHDDEPQDREQHHPGEA